jgi:hypothetical protein
MIPFEEAIHVAPTDQPLSESSHEAQKRLNEGIDQIASRISGNFGAT